jgi:3-isopropylmalate/(R)-2-methylmalate dehydratase small subunit
MNIAGKTIVFGDNTNADYIISGKYLGKTDLDELVPHLFEEIRPDFYQLLKTSRIIVAGENFGSGSSREMAPLLLKHAGVQCIIARSFARSFFRNGINLGLLLLEASLNSLEEGDRIMINLDQGQIVNQTRGNTARFRPLPGIMQSIMREGGLIPYYRKYRNLVITE